MLKFLDKPIGEGAVQAALDIITQAVRDNQLPEDLPKAVRKLVGAEHDLFHLHTLVLDQMPIPEGEGVPSNDPLLRAMWGLGYQMGRLKLLEEEVVRLKYALASGSVASA